MGKFAPNELEVNPASEFYPSFPATLAPNCLVVIVVVVVAVVVVVVVVVLLLLLLLLVSVRIFL